MNNITVNDRDDATGDRSAAQARKRRFNAALALEGITKLQWRTERFAVSHEHLNEVLNGDRPGGPEINEAIEGLIERHLHEMKDDGKDDDTGE